MNGYLLDTNVVSLEARQVDRPEVGRLQRLRSLSYLASLTVSELRFGELRIAEGGKRDRLRRFIDDLIADELPILPFDLAAAEWHAKERSRLVRIGRTPPFADGLIAAVAAANDLILITLNAKDFAAFQGVRVEAW